MKCTVSTAAYLNVRPDALSAASASRSSTHHALCTSPSSLLASSAALLDSSDSLVHDSRVRGRTEEGVGESEQSLYLTVECLVRSGDGL